MGGNTNSGQQTGSYPAIMTQARETIPPGVSGTGSTLQIPSGGVNQVPQSNIYSSAQPNVIGQTNLPGGGGGGGVLYPGGVPPSTIYHQGGLSGIKKCVRVVTKILGFN